MLLYIALQLSISLFAATRIAYDSYNPSGRQKESWTALTLGLSFVNIPYGLLLAQFISNMTFKIEDTFFTREAIA